MRQINSELPCVFHLSATVLHVHSDWTWLELVKGIILNRSDWPVNWASIR